jgi:outer membrane putative beta-barrel porin/alpha-amylase
MGEGFLRESCNGRHNSALAVGDAPVIKSALRLAAAVYVLALVAGPALAQDAEREFCADRPGKGSPTCTLDPGRFQAEAGIDYSHFEQGGVEDEGFGYGDLTLRLGLTDSLEGQILWTPYAVNREKVGGVTFEDSGTGDIGFSLRQNLINPDGSGTSVAVQAIVTAPTGSHGISADVWEGALMLPVSFEVSDDTALTGMVEVDWVGDAAGGGHHAGWAGVVGLEHAMGDFAVAGELWAQRDDDPLGGTTQASGGVQLMWTPASLDDVQFDIGVDFGLNDETPDLAFGAGIAKRF